MNKGVFVVFVRLGVLHIRVY